MRPSVILAAAALLVSALLYLVTETHEARQRYEQTCRETLSMELRWSPRARALGLPAEPCEAIRMVRRGR